MNEPLWITIRQTAQQGCIDNGEDRSVCANAERECEHGSESKAGVLHQHTNRVAQIRPEIVHGASCCECLLSGHRFIRSEEHTSELQSLRHLVCRLLLEKKKNR